MRRRVSFELSSVADSADTALPSATMFHVKQCPAPEHPGVASHAANRVEKPTTRSERFT